MSGPKTTAERAGRTLRKGKGRSLLYEEVKRRILSLDLAPGTELDEMALVEQYGISRTPVREALIKLSSEGLIVLVPNRGARVAPLDLTNIREFQEALELCQRVVTRWAALRRTADDVAAMTRHCGRYEKAARRIDIDAMIEANRDFHVAIGASCGNPYIAATYERLLSDGMRLVRIAMSFDERLSRRTLTEYVDRTVHEHREMVAAIRRQDAPAAETIAVRHAREGILRIADYLSHHLAETIELDFA